VYGEGSLMTDPHRFVIEEDFIKVLSDILFNFDCGERNEYI
jgi:hypothetical protein